MRLLFTFAACIATLVAQPAAHAQSEPGPANATLTLADNILDIRLLIMEPRKRFAYLEREFRRTPQDLPVKARYAECLIIGESDNGPKGREVEGVALAREAMDAKDSTALRAMGMAAALGRGAPQNIQDAISLVRRADEAGNTKATAMLGLLLFDEKTFDENTSESEDYCRKAARCGYPEALFKLGMLYEKDSTGFPISISKAAALLNEAAQYGSRQAYDHLKERSKEKVPRPELQRAYDLATLWYAALGSNMLQTPGVSASAKELEALYPQDPESLYVLGLAYRSGEYGLRDMKKAWGFLDKATTLGSNDARCERAAMLAEGQGVKKTPAAAIAEWRLLEKQNHPGALSYLGYYSYWGSLDDEGIPKDAAKCYDYSKRAADQGHYFGQLNVSQCYAFGVGTEKNYAQAVGYCRASAYRGSKRARRELPKLISAAFD